MRALVSLETLQKLPCLPKQMSLRKGRGPQCDGRPIFSHAVTLRFPLRGNLYGGQSSKFEKSDRSYCARGIENIKAPTRVNGGEVKVAFSDK